MGSNTFSQKVFQAGDGVCIILGGPSGIRFLKIDLEGNLISDKSFTGNGYSEALLPDSDAGYTIAGDDASGVFLIKTGSDGTVVWRKTCGEPDDRVGYSECFKHTGDGGYVLLGTAHYSQPSTSLFIIKTDPAGNVQWRKTYGDGEIGKGASIFPRGNGNYFIIGHKVNGTGDDHSAWLFETDPSGNMLWEKTLDGRSNEIIYDARETPDGYILSGYALNADTGDRHDGLLIKTDPSGNLQWKRTYNGNLIWGSDPFHHDNIVYSPVPVPDGGYLMLVQAWITSPTSYATAYLVKTDPPGNIQWTMRVNGQDLTPAGDGSYVVVGGTDPIYVPNTPFVIKVGPEPQPGVFTFGNITYPGNGNITIDVVRMNGSYLNASIEYATLNGTALPGVNFEPVTGILSFADGESNKTFNVTVLGGDLSRDTMFSVVLRNATIATMGSPNMTNVTVPRATVAAPPVIGQITAPGSEAPLSLVINSGTDLGSLAWKAALPVASIVLSALILAFWATIEKILQFLFGGIKAYFQGIYTKNVKKYMNTLAVQRIPLLFGLSSLEILVAIVTALLIGGAFAYVRNELFILQGLIVLVIVAGFSSVAHELAHWYVARGYRKEVEYKFWGVGTLTLILTTLLRYPFASPSNTVINNLETMDKKALGRIYIAGPVVSILLSILFLLMMLYGHGLGDVGKIGFNIGMMTCVYQMMPIKPLEGTRVLAWNKLVWGMVFLPSLIFYLGMVIFVFP